MVRGLDLFQKHFSSFKGRFILIGGTACDVLFEDAGLEFRPTKDLDIVLCLEALDKKFAEAFWDFIRSGDYEMRKRSSGRPEFFRFVKPKKDGYPVMLELFSRVPDTLVVPEDQHVVKIRMGEEVSSLSAILLDSDYYDLLHKGAKEVSGISVVGAEYLILLKARAYVDLITRSEKGEAVKEKNIKKHKNDVFRLLQISDPAFSVSVSDAVKEHFRDFLTRIQKEGVDLKALKLETQGLAAMVATLEKMYGIKNDFPEEEIQKPIA